MAEKRRSQRLKQDIMIQLVSMAPGATVVKAQPAQTVEVSEHGALIECRTKFEQGAELMIHNPKNLQNGLFKIVRSSLSPSGSSWRIGVEMQDRDLTDFWGLS